jgi:hypothetical protein
VEQRLYIRLPSTEDHEKLTKLKEAMDQKLGETPIVLVVGDDSDKKIIKLPNSIEPDEILMSKLSDIFGETSVKLQ